MHSFHRKAITSVKIKAKSEAAMLLAELQGNLNLDLSLPRSSDHYTNSFERMPLEGAVEEVRGRSVRR